MQANVYDIHQPDGLTHAALTHGLATIVVIATFGPISGGHFNPVVSWAAVLIRKLHPLLLPFYMFSQFFGGFCACLLSACLQKNRDFIVWENVGSVRYSIMNDSIESGYNRVHNTTWKKTILLTTQLAATSSGATTLGAENVWWEGLMSETITTYFFVTIILMNAMDTLPTAASPVIIGMMVVCDIFATASITGTAMNPVRALSPNVVAEIVLSSASIPHNFWTYHYIYWAGPYLGSTIAVIGYKLLLSRNDRFIA
uniref:Aquaporin n=1 Tax=Caenorhabditis japonica TaxID=281687 RepID=A0A8R1DLV2_CAEJA